MTMKAVVIREDGAEQFDHVDHGQKSSVRIAIESIRLPSIQSKAIASVTPTDTADKIVKSGRGMNIAQRIKAVNGMRLSGG